MAADEVTKVTALNREHFSCRHADEGVVTSRHVLTTPLLLLHKDAVQIGSQEVGHDPSALHYCLFLLLSEAY